VNEILPAVWSERVVRLRLGIEPVDALGRTGPLAGLGLHLEDVPRPVPLPRGRPGATPFGDIDAGVGLPRVPQSPSGRFAIAFPPAAPRGLANDGTERPGQPTGAPLVVRILDRRRRYVPRRLSIPVPRLTEVLTADPPAPRACRPALYPGTSYGPGPGATVVRARVTWDAGGQPAQWVRVVAYAQGAPQPREPLGRAHGDDRGEFLLVLATLPRELAGQRTQTLDVELQVTARPVPDKDVTVDSPTASRDDPLWHLPVEPVAALAPDDAVAAGTVDPPGFSASSTRVLPCRRGSVTQTSFVLT
jgi:hypothetical protein